MKIRTQENLTDFLNDEIAWRKKELSTIKTNVLKSNQKLEATAIRSGIVLLYAHWEGFIKCASEAYLEYVISRRLNYGDLTNNFIAISAKQKIKEFEDSNKATIHTQFIEFILNNHDERIQINKDNVIKTKSNLNSIILKEIISSIGLDFSPYETKSKMIDEQLLNYRNNVAHGQILQVDAKEYIFLHDEIRKMIDAYKTDIENAVVQSIFLKKVS
ncbi:hypothetical protein EMA8858_04182 [Emticicia aquatica]|uniref:RiboL-PSP-HEPN domain-containing protein n=1 Tax=Emticicia aquatica TaxID=1681835 RepID=A0ABN8F1Y3_9BACT|nr:MAE_28990/MAE_18760 family HEPN-like nuclease [Emticicia aquatica]CAH0998047.1 hypothetical protein EMA8858_04182 [Emticicia aquatica]